MEDVSPQFVGPRETDSVDELTEVIPQGIWRCDPDGHADYCSRRFVEMVGYSDAELLGWGWADLIHPDDRSRVLSEWQAARDAGGAVSIEFRVRRHDGDYRWFLGQGNPQRDECGKILKYYGTWTDVDDQKRAALENVELLRREREATRARDDFMSAASHELKTPLTALKLQAQLMRHLRQKGDPEAFTPERIDQLLEQVDRQVNHLGRLVDDMIDISRIQSGRLNLRRAPLRLGDVVEHAVAEVPRRIANGGEIRWAAAVAIDFTGDFERLTQVVSILLLNALRYGRGQPVEVSLRRDADAAVIAVSDLGPGVPIDLRDRIFERGASGRGGLGLGLFIAREIVRGHGGDIELASEPGRGATFTVRLPI